MKLTLCFILTCLSLAVKSQDTDLTVIIHGVKSEKGTVLFAMFSNRSDFLGEEVFATKKGQIQKGKVTVIFKNIPHGQYAISSFLDINENNVLDKNFLGIPKEPYAFSMNPDTRFGPPSFDQAAFILDQPTQTITIKY